MRDVLSTNEMRATYLVLSSLLVYPATGAAALFHRGSMGHNNSHITLQKRLHVNTLITEPGTMEIDWSNLYSFSTENFAMPSGVRWTPAGSHIIWGRTEYSAAFDTVTSANVASGRLTQFSQALTLTATSVLHDGAKLDIAIAPQASFFLRDEQGARLGAIAIARYDSGRNSLGATVSWSGATHSSATNPAGTVDVGFGFGRQLQGSALLEKFTPHMNAEWERSTGLSNAVLASEGIEYQITERFAFDVAMQHYATAHAAPDHQIAAGITVNLGKLQ
jgi:hypothetical protein